MTPVSRGTHYFFYAVFLFTSSCLFFNQQRASASSCPDLKPVPVDKKLFTSLQPENGFYAPLVSGYDQMPSYKPKPMKELKGSVKVCYKSRLMVNGKEVMAAPGIECSGKSISQFTCKTPAAGQALAPPGITVPEKILNTFVDTDNKTFIAMGGCMDGAEYAWAIFTTKQGNKKVHAATLKALHITVKDLKANEKKKYKNGQTRILLGECDKGAFGGLGSLLGGD